MEGKASFTLSPLTSPSCQRYKNGNLRASVVDSKPDGDKNTRRVDVDRSANIQICSIWTRSKTSESFIQVIPSKPELANSPVF